MAKNLDNVKFAIRAFVWDDAEQPHRYIKGVPSDSPKCGTCAIFDECTNSDRKAAVICCAAEQYYGKGERCNFY